MSTIEVTITPTATVFAPEEIANPEALLAHLNRHPFLSAFLEQFRPWSIEAKDDADDDLVVYLRGSKAEYVVRSNEDGDVADGEAEEIRDDLHLLLKRIPGWSVDICDVDLEVV